MRGKPRKNGSLLVVFAAATSRRFCTHRCRSDRLARLFPLAHSTNSTHASPANKCVFDLVMRFGASKSPNRSRSLTAYCAPTAPRSSRFRTAHCSYAARALLHHAHNDLWRVGCPVCMPYIAPYRSQSRPYNRAYTYRRLTAFASLSIAVSDGIETARNEMRLLRRPCR